MIPNILTILFSVKIMNIISGYQQNLQLQVGNIIHILRSLFTAVYCGGHLMKIGCHTELQF